MHPADTPSPARAGAQLAACALLLAAVVIAWSNAWHTAFQFDDFVAFVDVPATHGPGAWWASMPGLRPLLKLSYVVSWLTGGGAPRAFFAFNLAVHAANTLLVFVLAQRLLVWVGADLAHNAQQRRIAALVTALLFAVHPAQTESVTYLSGRSGALMALFWLAALWAWLRDTHRARVAALALFACALACKETAASWPLCVLLVEGLRRGDWRSAWRAARWPLATLAVLGSLLLALPAYRRLAAASLATRDPLANLAAQVDGIAYLVTRTLLALHTNIDPDISTAPGTLAWWTGALAIGGAVLAWVHALRARRAPGPPRLTSPLAALAIGWTVATLVPTNSLIARYDLANDRQWYLAIIGPALAIAVLAVRLRLAAPVAALVVVLGAATLQRNLDYRDEVSLWRVTAAKSPLKARVFNNLGWAHEQSGNVAAARAAYDRALLLDPADFKARANAARLGGEARPAGPGVLQ